MRKKCKDYLKYFKVYLGRGFKVHWSSQIVIVLKNPALCKLVEGTCDISDRHQMAPPH